MNKSCRRKGSWVNAGTIALLGLSLAPAQAVPLLEFAYFPKSDYASGGTGGLRSNFQIPVPGPFPGTFLFVPNPATPVSGSISLNFPSPVQSVQQAFLIWHGNISNQTSPGTSGSILLNQQSVTGVLLGTSSPNGWNQPPFGPSEFSQAFLADVTSIVAPAVQGASGPISFALSAGSPLNLGANGASLLVVYKDADPANDWDLHLYAGNDSSESGAFDSAGWSAFFPGVFYNTGGAFLQLHASDAQQSAPVPSPAWVPALAPNGSPLLDAQGNPLYTQTGPTQSDQLDGELLLTNFTSTPQTFQLAEPGSDLFAGNTLAGWNPFITGALWDIQEFAIEPALVPGPNQLSLSAAKGQDCLSLVAAVLGVRSTQDTGTGGVIPTTPPVLQCAIPSVVSSPSLSGVAVNLAATVSDADEDALSALVSVKSTLTGVVVYTDQRNLPAASTASAQTTVWTPILPPGDYTVTVQLADGEATVSCDSALQVRFVDGEAPVIVSAPTVVRLIPGADGRGPVPDVTSQVRATDNSGSVQITQSIPTGTLLPPGEHPLVVTVRDATGNQKTVTIQLVVPTPGPTVSCSVLVGELLRNDKELVRVGFSATGSGPVEILVYSNEDDVTEAPKSGSRKVYDKDKGKEKDDDKDEDSKGKKDDDEDEDDDDDNKGSSSSQFSPDAKNGPRGLRLRAECLSSGNGRIYLIVAKVTDSQGRTSTCTSTVVVPKDRSQASRAAISHAAAQAQAGYSASNQPPAGFSVVGDGPIISSKQ